MDQAQFQDAQRAYDAGDYRAAAKGFLASAGKGSAGNGAAYHMAGNALIKLRRNADAITVYGHALRDDMYNKRGVVRANLGAAYSAMGEYADAVREYEAALAEPDYETPYKAWQGIAKCFMERGHVDEAAVAYRRAALDEANPDPGKSLNNLGLCFMALGRPSDAVEAYKAALGFDTYQARGKALSNLGQAYTQMGEYDEAVKAFEKALQLHDHPLSAAAQSAYDVAASQVGGAPMTTGTETPGFVPAAPVAASAALAQPDPAPMQPSRDVVDGWESGQMPSALSETPPGGWETTELQALTGLDATLPEAAKAADALGFGDEQAVSDFFNLTEDEMKNRDREVRKSERAQRRSSGGTLRTVILAVLLVVVLVGALGAAYWFGFGWPTQTNTVTGLLDSYGGGQPVEKYWVAVPTKDVAKEMAKIPPVKEFTVESVTKGPQASQVKVTVTPEKGAPLHYVITMSREGVGWKVNGVENDWSSTGGS